MRAVSLAPIMLVTLIGVYMITTGFAFAIVAPVLTPLAGAFRTGVATAAYISTFYFLGSLLMSMPAGLTLDRWGPRKAGVLDYFFLRSAGARVILPGRSQFFFSEGSLSVWERWRWP
ncbi:MAG: hypothetical protein ACP5T5_04030 [Thermoprotei archaeon]